MTPILDLKRGGTMGRRELRENTFKLLFHQEFYTGTELNEQLDNYLEEEEFKVADKALLKKRVMAILKELPVLDAEIEQKTIGWKLKRMNRVDLTLIRLALYEIKHDDQVPVGVAINEAVELAKVYGGDESPQFVNGVLSKLVS